MLRRTALALDANGDGEVSLDELEGVGTRLWHLVQKWRHQCTEQLRRPAIHGGIGLMVLFYGGHFKHLAVIVHSLEGGQLEQLQEQCSEVASEYRLARERLAEAEGSSAAGFVVVPPGPQLGRAALLADPRALFASLQRLQTSTIAQVAAALNKNTSRILLGMEFGRWASEAAGDRLETLLLGQAGEAEEEVSGDSRVWVRLGIDMACTASGVMVAWALRGWAALWTTCGVGALMCVESLDGGRRLGWGGRPVVWRSVLGAIGFAYQATYWGKPPLPGPLWVLTAPVRALELAVVSLA